MKNVLEQTKSLTHYKEYEKGFNSLFKAIERD
jgi:hypothetical protein